MAETEQELYKTTLYIDGDVGSSMRITADQEAIDQLTEFDLFNLAAVEWSAHLRAIIEGRTQLQAAGGSVTEELEALLKSIQTARLRLGEKLAEGDQVLTALARLRARSHSQT